MDRLKIRNGLKINKMLCCISLRSGTLFLLWCTFLFSIHMAITFFFYAAFSDYNSLVISIAFLSPTIISYRALINIPAPKEKCDVGSATAKTLYLFIILYELLVALVFIVGVIVIAWISYYSHRMHSSDPEPVIAAFFSLIFTATSLHFLAVLYSYYVEVTTPSNIEIATVDVFSSVQRQNADINR